MLPMITLMVKGILGLDLKYVPVFCLYVGNVGHVRNAGWTKLRTYLQKKTLRVIDTAAL